MAIGGKRTPRGEAASPINDFSRSDFFDAVATAGFTTSRERQNVGEWNENVTHVVNGMVVGVTMKSERVDWHNMTIDVNKMAEGN